MEQDDGREDDLNSLNTQITPRPTVFAVAAATEESQTSLTRGPVEPAEAVDPTPAHGGIWTGGLLGQRESAADCRQLPPWRQSSSNLISCMVKMYEEAYYIHNKYVPGVLPQPEGEVVFELAEDDIEREEDTHVVGMNQHMGERSEESRRGTKKAEIKTMKKQRSRGEGKGENEGEIKVEEEVEMERKKGEGESGEFHREREAEAEADGDAAKPRSGMGEEKEEQNGRNRWKRERWVDRPPLTHLRLASSSALVRELRRVGNRGNGINSTSIHPRVDLAPVRVAAGGEGQSRLEPTSPRHFRGQVHVAAAVARREKPSIEPPDITPEGPPPAQGESMHVAPAAGNKTASYCFSARRSVRGFSSFAAAEC
ncbi:hypothetical protein B0H14DRAFT_2578141 [Mycena olivaceomarginata]|nr:hypothetical protein B0H14DRAFT_2578141 [Mycena olivaceomarginata]